MFNRSSEQQNMSEFMKGKILEEDDDENEEDEEKNTDTVAAQQQRLQQSQKKNKLDEDFMFQMDKGIQ
jgi:hypothetical protein